MRCPKCGCESNGKFCQNCGANLDGDNNDYFYNANPPKINLPIKQKWYTKAWFTIFMLIFFFPVGLYLMWKYRTWNKLVKIIITAIFVLMFLETVLSDENNSDSEQTQASSEQITSDKQETEQAVTAEPKKPSNKAEKADDNTIDVVINDCHIKYVSHEVTVNAVDTKCVAVYYEFTNNSDENESFGYLTDAKAFQNGVQLEDSLFITENDTETSYSEIKPGTTTTVCEAYEIRDDSDVTLEITKIFRDKIEDSMTIKIK